MPEMRGIDISNHQGSAGFRISNHLQQIDFCICKATEGTYYVDPYCDVFIQTLKSAAKPWGFYHFASTGDAVAEADYFYENCSNYFGEGIPVLDWEGEQSVAWVNEFTSRIYELTKVHPWIYGNPWRFNQGGVDSNCMRWIASYPNVLNPPLDYALPEVPETDGLVGAWQFCSDGRLSGYSGDMDFDVFYGDTAIWGKYVIGDREQQEQPEQPEQPDDASSTSVFEDEKVKVEVTIK